MPSARISATIAAVAALAVPASALAQSAGDNQYQDPLAGTHTSHHSSSGSSGSQASTPSGTSSGSSGTSPATSSTPSAAATTASPSASSGRQLPRTGFGLLVPIELGLALLLSGVTLRRVLVLRDRR